MITWDVCEVALRHWLRALLCFVVIVSSCALRADFYNSSCTAGVLAHALLCLVSLVRLDFFCSQRLLWSLFILACVEDFLVLVLSLKVCATCPFECQIPVCPSPFVITSVEALTCERSGRCGPERVCLKGVKSLRSGPPSACLGLYSAGQQNPSKIE